MMRSADGPAYILMGMSSDPDDSKDLLLWAVMVLARPNDNIVAVHVLDGEGQMNKRHLSSVRRAKAYVISVLGELSKACQLHQIHLEARVNSSTSIGKGLIEEVKSLPADFLLLHRSRGRSASTRQGHDIAKYCLKNAPGECAVVSVGRNARTQHTYLYSRRLKDGNSGFKGGKGMGGSSPTTILDRVSKDSFSTEEYTSSLVDTSTTDTTAVATNLVMKSFQKKQVYSPYKLISSLFLGFLVRKGSITMSKTENLLPPLRCFTHEEIMNATNSFHPDYKVGQGGYSEVYRGNLPDIGLIAVKMLAKDNKDEKKEREFLIELGTIVHVSHPNAATLVGYCIENGLYLIFHFSQNGNLASALHGKSCTPLDWHTRYKIAIGVARGLHYLHKCCKHRIIHRDIKASNILLDPEYEPQITDFGLAKWLPNKWTHQTVIPIEGTFGYLAPEYFMHGIVDEKTDVFAFGVLLLEIVTGRRPVDSAKQNLLLWAMPHIESGELASLVDPKLEGQYDSKQLHRVVLAASHCIRQSSTWRPTMSTVLELLLNGNNSKEEKSWRIQKFSSDEMDDFSMVFGYEVPTDISLEDLINH
ncbi:hypothetical protein MLD38_014051 [Melastoma candidum]|uniref:Uncharacterized protein n=1 Tax=Melastoma candidum TaxID=119954 RepID=A0ACB9RBL0_9MYRT|nr:hypothetical protein MLD38_014051 [Melastoma candidum]